MNKRAVYYLLSFLLVELAVTGLHAQTTMRGGRGLLRVQSAETIGPRTAYGNLIVSSFAKEQNNALLKDYTMTIGLTLGLSHSFELMVGLVPYQDDQEHIWGPPGHTYLGMKYHLPLSAQNFHLGLLGTVKFPTAATADVPFEPYASDKTAASLHVLMTMDLADAMPALPLKFHLNVGYVDHSFEDRFFEDRSDQLALGLGFKFPVRASLFYTEFTSELFIRAKDELAFAENLMRVTQGFKFIGPLSLIYDFAFDIGLTANDPTTIGKPKEFASWKVLFGVSKRFSFRRHSRAQTVAQRKRIVEQSRLNKIKRRRERAGEDLKRLRRVLEGSTPDEDDEEP